MILQKMRTTLLSIERVYCNAGHSSPEARVKIARDLRIGPGTLENLIRERVKTVCADLAAKVQAYWIDTIEAEIARLEKERALALQDNIDVSADDIAQAETLLAEARRLVRQKKTGRR
jgi:hypothetical protein